MPRRIALRAVIVGLLWMGLTWGIETAERGYVDLAVVAAFLLLAIIAILVLFKWPKSR